MSAPDDPGREAANWLERLVRSTTLTVEEVTARMGHTDQGLALLLAQYAVGPQAVLCRARQRAVLGLGAHESAPPDLAVRLAVVMHNHASGTALPPDLVQGLDQVRAHWRAVHATASG